MRKHPDYEEAKERIEAAWDEVNDAVEELRSQQGRLVAILRKSLPKPPALPQAEPEGVPGVPLFDSEADYVTATKRLIDRKMLIPDEGQRTD
jgi:hypothetical protein